MSYIYGAPSKARNANVVYIWTYVWQRIISVKYSSILPDDGSHTIRNMLE